jgi:hypothetical protein
VIPPQALAIGAGLMLVAGFVGGWSSRDLIADAAYSKAVDKLIATKDRMQGKIDAKSTEYEAFRQSIEPARTETFNTIKEVYRNVSVPADCALRPDALGVLENARARANAAAAGQSGKLVPDDPADPDAGP